MALASTVVWEVRTTGDDTNGGGFNSASAGTDYSQQNTPVLTVTDAATSGVGSTTLTSATGGFTAAMVGNVVHLYGGLNLIEGWYEITGYTDGNTVTLDRAPDDGVGGVSGATCKVGGALGSPGGLGATLTNAGRDGQKVWIKSGTYTLTTATENTPGGPLKLPGSVFLAVRGYDTVRGDAVAKPLISAGAITGISLVTVVAYFNDSSQVVENIEVDGNNGAGNNGIVDTGSNYRQCHIFKCVARNCPGTGIGAPSSNPQSQIHNCYAYNCGVGFRGEMIINSVAESCTTGFKSGTLSGAYVKSLAVSCSTGFELAENGGYAVAAWGCVAYGCTDGFKWTSYDMGTCIECVSVGCSGYGYNTHTTWVGSVVYRCAGYNNTSGTYRSNFTPLSPITITGDPFVDAANGDFRLNNTPGAGAVLRGAGLGVYGQTDNQDVGAVQHSDPAGGGGTTIITRPRRVM